MNIRINFTAQIRDIIGKPFEQINIPEGTSLQDTLQKISHTHPKLKGVLFDKNDRFISSNLLIINGVQINYDDNPPLTKNDLITLMSPISGG